jgi:hypothetical protein
MNYELWIMNAGGRKKSKKVDFGDAWGRPIIFNFQFSIFN